MPDPSTFSFEDATAPADSFSFEEATSPEEPAFKPFTGPIPVPPEFDPVTLQKRYLGPWTGGPMSPYAPEQMQEATQTALAPLRLAGEVSGGILGSVSEMAVDWLRRSGLDPSARPGEPLVNVPPGVLENMPGLGPVVGLAKMAAPEATRGVTEEAARQLSGFTEPGTAATLPLAPASKLVQGLYMAGAAAGIPESMQRVIEARGPAETGGALTGLGANIGMFELMRRGMTREAALQQALDQYYATQERPVRQDAQREYPQAGAGGIPAEAGGGYRVQRAAALPQETQILLDQAVENNRSLGIGHQLDILPDFGPSDPKQRRVFRTTPPAVDPQTGKVVAPGRIQMNRAAFDQWLAFVPEAERATAIRSALSEEGIHATITGKMARAYYESLSKLERALGERQYLAGTPEALAGWTPENRATLAGHELLRMRMQQLLRMPTTELAEVKGFERWSRASIQAVADVIRSIREIVGTKGAEAGGQMTNELLARYEQNLNRVAAASGQPEPFPDIYGGEQPFMIRRGAGEKRPQDIAEMDDAAATEYFKGIRAQGMGPQYDSVAAGLKLSPQDLPELQRLHDESGKKMMAALQAGDEKAFQAQFGKNVWYAGAIEGAQRKGPNYERFEAETLFPVSRATGQAGREVLPGVPREGAKAMETAESFREAQRALSSVQDALKELPPKPEGTIRLYHGEGGPGGAGMDAQWFSEVPERAATYGGQMSYVDVPREVAEYTQRLARKAGSGTAADHFLPNEWVMRAEGVPQKVQQKVYDLGPAMIRRKGAPGAQRELFLPPAQAGEPRPTAAELGATGLNMERMKAETMQHLTREAAPDFETFAKEMEVSYGVKPAQLRDVWYDSIKKRLMTASGTELQNMVRAMGLTKELKLETPGGEERQIPDPAPVPPEEVPKPQVPGVTRPHFVLPGRKLYGPYDVPFRPTAAPPSPTFTKAQQLRLRVVASLMNRLIQQAEGRRLALNRAEVSPEEIADPRMATKEPSWNVFTKADEANVDTLGRQLTDDARAFGGAKVKKSVGGRIMEIVQKGLPVSVTKRLTVIQDRVSGAVHMVSTYRDPRRGPVLLNPGAPRGTHSPLEQILKSHRVLYSVLLDDPVKSFDQKFKNLATFQDEFGTHARDLAERYAGYEPPPVEGEPVPEVGPGKALRDPVTGDEAGAILDSILSEQATFDSPADVKEALMSAGLARNKNAVLGLKKLALEIDRQNPDLTLPEIIDRLANQLYANHKEAKTFEEFQRRTISLGPAESGKALGIGAQAPEEFVSPTARELALPTFARRAAPAPPGPGPEPRLPAPTPPEMLDPRSRAMIEARIREQAMEPPATLEQATTDAGAVKDVGTEEMPAMLRRVRQTVEDEYRLMVDHIVWLGKHAATTEQITGGIDGADVRAHKTSRTVEFAIRLQSITKPGSFIMQKLKPWLHGDRKVLAASNVLVEAGGVRNDGSIDTGAVQTAIPHFRQLLDQGQVQAENMLNTGGYRQRRLAQAWLRTIKLYRDEINYAEAHLNDPDLQKTAARVHLTLREQWDREMSLGYETTRKTSYLPHRYDTKLWYARPALLLGRPRIIGTQWKEGRVYDTYYNAIADGPYIPVTRDAASLVSHRVLQSERMINRDTWQESLKTLPGPDGRPIAINAVTMKGQRWGSPQADYKFIEKSGGKPLVVQQDFASLFRQLTGRNFLQDWAFTRNALAFEAGLKHTLLLGDFFHMGRVTYYGLSLMGRRIGWKGGWAVLDINPRDVPEAVRRGVITQKDADWANTPVTLGSGPRARTFTYRQIANAFSSGTVGLNVGAIQDALYKDLMTAMTPSSGPLRRFFVTVIDPSVGRYNRFLFDQYTRGLMIESAVREFHRQAKANPNYDFTRIAKDISKDVNAYFGNLGRQGWLKAEWQRDLARILFLAPQWVEGLLRKEFFGGYPRLIGAGARALGAPVRQGLPPMGTMGRGLARGMFAMLLLTQAINLITRRKPTWMNEESEHKFDAFIPGVGADETGFFLSPFALFNEITHDLYRLIQDKPQAMQAIAQVYGNKMSPLQRAWITMITGRTPTGTYLTSSGSRLASTVQQLAPVPITFGRYMRAAGHMALPGMIEPNLPGAVQRQAFGTFGLKIEPGKSPLQEMQKLARQFAQEKGRVETIHIEETDQPSYSRLRQAVRLGDKHGAWKVLDKLRAQGKDDSQIVKNMKVWRDRNFTWSDTTESEFQWWLSPHQREMKSAAEWQRQAEYQKFLDYLMEQPR